jgi:hypothetical protein
LEGLKGGGLKLEPRKANVSNAGKLSTKTFSAFSDKSHIYFDAATKRISLTSSLAN